MLTLDRYESVDGDVVETIQDKANFDAVVDIVIEAQHGDGATPRRRKPPAKPNPQGVVQLAAVLAACDARDTYRGQATSPQNSPAIVEAAKRRHQRSLDVVVVAFERTLRREAKRYATVDSCGHPVEFDDALQTARLGLVDAVDRYDIERGSGGCVWFVTSRVKYTLQQSLLKTKRKPRQEVAVDFGCVDGDTLPWRQHGDELWAPPAAASPGRRIS